MSLDLVIDRDLIRKYGANWPAYICYPTAEDFEPSFGASTYETWLQQRRTGGPARPLALYVGVLSRKALAGQRHGNTVVTGDHGLATECARHLNREFALVAERFQEDREVRRMSCGAAWLEFLGEAGIADLMQTAKSAFALDPAGEYSIQVDPRTVTDALIASLAGFGFNHIGMGFVDPDPAARQVANDVRRVDKMTQAIVAARASGFRSVGVELVCDLPGQDGGAFGNVLDHLSGSSPDRVTLKSSRDTSDALEPPRSVAAAEQAARGSTLSLLTSAIDRLDQAGYVYIGMGQFAKPDDELAAAKRQGRLTHDCCGYSASGYYDVIGLGPAAIAQVGPIYWQNYATLDAYCASLARGTLPVMRGVVLTRDDLARRSVIESLICHFEVCLESVSSAFLIDFRKHFSTEMAALEPLVAEGVVEIDDEWITVTPRGKLVAHAICRVFDRRSRQAPDIRGESATPTPGQTHRPGG